VGQVWGLVVGDEAEQDVLAWAQVLVGSLLGAGDDHVRPAGIGLAVK